jgi:hypothetical protein
LVHDGDIKNATPNVTDCLAVKSKLLLSSTHEFATVTPNVQTTFLGGLMNPNKDSIYGPSTTVEASP